MGIGDIGWMMEDRGYVIDIDMDRYGIDRLHFFMYLSRDQTVLP